MNLALNSFEKQRDVGLFVMRVVVGATFVFFGWQHLLAGKGAWIKLGEAMAHFGVSDGTLYWGLAATFAELLGGLFLVIGLLVRPSAVALFAAMVVATVVRWQSLDWGNLDRVALFFYPLAMAAVAFALIFLGGGKFGFDGAGGGGGASPSKEK